MRTPVLTARAILAGLSPSGPNGRLAVFCYHQVLGEKSVWRKDEPSADEFMEDLEIIRSLFNVLSLPDAVAMLKAGTIPRRSAAITFDDGYENNFTVASPILESMDVPATFFIAGGAVDQGVMWNDLVIDALAASNGVPVLPPSADIDTGPNNGLSPDGVVSLVLGQMKYLPVETRWALAEEMYQLNVERSLPRYMMTRDMVHGLATRGFDVGAHTISHPILNELPDGDAMAEISNFPAPIS